MNKFKLGVLAMAMFVSNAFAVENASANFQAGATLNASCVISTESISFGTITPAATGTATTTGIINTLCSKSVHYAITISAGTSGNALSRAMTGTSDNTDKLNYNIYNIAVEEDSVWGDGTNGSTSVGYQSLGTLQKSIVYGSLDLNQYIKPDTYTDSLTVTLTY